MQINPDVKALVCERCWKSVFSSESFRTIWEGSAEGIKLVKQSILFDIKLTTDTDYLQMKDKYRNGLYETLLTYKTPPWAEILQSVEEHCGYCTLLCTLIKDARGSSRLPTEPLADESSTITMMFDLESTMQKILIIVWMEGALIISELGIYTEPDDPASQHIRNRNVVWKMDEDSSYELALKCVSDCSQHGHCPQPAPSALPTRVLDCSNPLRLRLLTTNSSVMDYFAALSYVWGGPQLHCTTMANLNTYHDFIDLTKLPKTIADAITVTRRLGLRYLWVDSFCIIQDSEEDKAKELGKMRLIFRNAYITILAARANAVNEGFLQNASPSNYFHPTVLPFICPDGPIGTMMVTRYGSGGPVEPVDSRAWCLGERVLSPRILIFSTLGLQYECQTSRMNVNGSAVGLPLAVPRLPDYAFMEDSGRDGGGELAKSWDTILQQYTACNLTCQEDKLPALSGVAEQVHRLWPHSRYVAGLWTHQFPTALLWGQGTRVKRPNIYRAPSWSWASVDGRLVSGGLTGSSDVWDATPKFVKSVCEVKHVAVDLQYSSNPYGGITSASIVICAELSQASWNTREVDQPQSLVYAEDSSNTLMVVGYRDLDQRIGRLELDAIEPYEDFITQITLVALTTVGVPSPYIIRSGQDNTHGLILVPFREEKEEIITLYRRIGKFIMNTEDWRPIRTQDIHII